MRHPASCAAAAPCATAACTTMARPLPIVVATNHSNHARGERGAAPRPRGEGGPRRRDRAERGFRAVRRGGGAVLRLCGEGGGTGCVERGAAGSTERGSRDAAAARRGGAATPWPRGEGGLRPHGQGAAAPPSREEGAAAPPSPEEGGAALPSREEGAAAPRSRGERELRPRGEEGAGRGATAARRGERGAAVVKPGNAGGGGGHSAADEGDQYRVTEEGLLCCPLMLLSCSFPLSTLHPFVPRIHFSHPLPVPATREEERQWLNQARQAAVEDVVQRMKEISMVMAITEEGLLASHSLLILVSLVRAFPLSEEEWQWFNQAMQAAVVDIVQWIKEISMQPSECLSPSLPPSPPTDLKAIGGLEPPLRFLKSPHAILRARAAEMVTTMVQNNEKSQINVMDAGAHLTLMDMILHDVDVTARTKAVGAISSLVRRNSEGMVSLQALVGINRLTSLISSAAQPTNDTTTTTDTSSSTTTTTTKLLLKALHLALYFLQQFPSDHPLALSSGLLALLLQPGMVGSQDGDGDEVSGVEVVIGARMEAISALQKRQSR
ncbi:unnamed protein product [Closterium sp. Naga37s-1]|nr:unnamed protein product [Closterium sp. Naga37s-1]